VFTLNFNPILTVLKKITMKAWDETLFSMYINDDFSLIRHLPAPIDRSAALSSDEGGSFFPSGTASSICSLYGTVNEMGDATF
jgi:hypothetical protein